MTNSSTSDLILRVLQVCVAALDGTRLPERVSPVVIDTVNRSLAMLARANEAGVRPRRRRVLSCTWGWSHESRREQRVPKPGSVSCPLPGPQSSTICDKTGGAAYGMGQACCNWGTERVLALLSVLTADDDLEVAS